jgi:hypothetical protein
VSCNAPCSPTKAFEVEIARTEIRTRLRCVRCIAIMPKPASRKVSIKATLFA